MQLNLTLDRYLLLFSLPLSTNIELSIIYFHNCPHTISQSVLNVSHKLPNTKTPFSKNKTKDYINNRRFDTNTELIKIERRASTISAMIDVVRQMNKDLEKSLPSNILKSKKNQN